MNVSVQNVQLAVEKENQTLQTLQIYPPFHCIFPRAFLCMLKGSFLWMCTFSFLYTLFCVFLWIFSVRSFKCPLICWFIYPLVRSIFDPPVRSKSLARSFVCINVCSFLWSFVHFFVGSSVCPCNVTPFLRLIYQLSINQN